MGTSNFDDVEISGTLKLGGNTINPTEMGYLDNITPGTAAASKALVLDSNKDVTGIRDLAMRKVKLADSASDHTITFESATDEAANRTITIPALGGNKTMALADVAQTFSAAQTFANFIYNTVARTATADGTGAGTVADSGLLQFVTVTCDDANKIIVLPTPTPGTIVVLINGGTGYELRSSAPATIAINGGSGANAESAIAASTLVIAVCKTATAWAAFSLVGTTLAAVEAAA